MWVRDTKEGIILKLRVQPSAKKKEIKGMWMDSIKVRVTEPPLDGRANDSCIALLSEELDIPKKNITIISGHNSRNKEVYISGLNEENLKARLKLT